MTSVSGNYFKKEDELRGPEALPLSRPTKVPGDKAATRRNQRILALMNTG